MVGKGNLVVFESKLKMSKIFETGEAMPTKIGFHTFHIHLFLHEFLKHHSCLFCVIHRHLVMSFFHK